MVSRKAFCCFLAIFFTVSGVFIKNMSKKSKKSYENPLVAVMNVVGGEDSFDEKKEADKKQFTITDLANRLNDGISEVILF